MISIIVPIYNEELLVERLNDALHCVMEETRELWEVIYVNDGSNDQTLDILTQIHNDHSGTVMVADLSRNWGHQAAITAGLSLAQGDAIIIMDGDFQDPPSLIPELLAKWKDGADIVIARRTKRAETRLRRFFFAAFYRALGLLSDFTVPLGVGVFGLIDKKVSTVLMCLQETNRFLPGLRAWLGFRTAFVDFERPDRAAGKPKQTFGRLFKYGIDAILSFSYKPLRLAIGLGVISTVVASIAGMIVVVMGVAHRGMFRNNLAFTLAVVISSLFLIVSMQLICVGIVGEYIGRIYDEVRRRPLFVIRNVLERQSLSTKKLREMPFLSAEVG
jgi:polyisoprenyl-phosphate glycosyltransferase